MLNLIVLHGRLVRDPELRRTQSGTAVCSFTLAVDRDVKDKDGNKITDFIDHVAWRSAAEHICKHFRKGSAAITEGRLELRDWTDKDGIKRRAAEVKVENIYFGESKRAQDGGSNSNDAASLAGEPADSGTADFSELPDIGDDGLPF